VLFDNMLAATADSDADAQAGVQVKLIAEYVLCAAAAPVYDPLSWLTKLSLWCRPAKVLQKFVLCKHAWLMVYRNGV
jgi:hypothetical protein